MSEIIDLTGQVFHRLTVLSFYGINNSRQAEWLCECECKKTHVVSSGNLRRGDVKSCGCLAPTRDIKGERFGKLTAIEQIGTVKWQALWRCACDCGKEVITRRRYLVTGGKRSCGCLKVKRREGDIIGRLTVIREAGRNEKREVLWECRCECGTVIVLTSQRISDGSTISCGCANLEAMQRNFEEYRMTITRDGTRLDLLNNALRTNNTSGITGVGYRKDTQRWYAKITFQYKVYSLGSFKTIEEAAEARRQAEQEIFDPILEKHGREPTSDALYQELLTTAVDRAREYEQYNVSDNKS